MGGGPPQVGLGTVLVVAPSLKYCVSGGPPSSSRTGYCAGGEPPLSVGLGTVWMVGPLHQVRLGTGWVVSSLPQQDWVLFGWCAPSLEYCVGGGPPPSVGLGTVGVVCPLPRVLCGWCAPSLE